jgi:replication factor C subunit 3/5
VSQTVVEKLPCCLLAFRIDSDLSLSFSFSIDSFTTIMLWVDKHRPSRFEDLTYHDDTTSRLRSLASNPASMPHLLLYGPSGAGKKTRVNCLLRALYGPGAEKLRLEKRTFTTPTKRVVEVNMVASNYHLELSPGDAGLNDRFVVQDVIKEIASHKNLAGGGLSGEDDSNRKQQRSSPPDFKTLVLVEIDRLSRQAQAALRRTMEKYTSTCRLILVCNSPSKVLEPVRSRCLMVRVAAPSVDDIVHVLQTAAAKEGLTVPDSLAVSIARESSRNVRRALLMLEASAVQHRSSSALPADAVVHKTDWELYIRTLAEDVTREQSPQRLQAAREKLYELLVSCIPATVILKTLVVELTRNLDDSLKTQVYYWAAFYEHRIACGSKEIFHLEAFLAKYMALYKRYLHELFG